MKRIKDGMKSVFGKVSECVTVIFMTVTVLLAVYGCLIVFNSPYTAKGGELEPGFMKQSLYKVKSVFGVDDPPDRIIYDHNGDRYIYKSPEKLNKDVDENELD